MTKIPVTARIAIDDSLLSESFIASSGPGGQNVNKVASAVQLRFEAARANLPADVHARLRNLAGAKLTRDGAILITARRFRDQQKNRDDARARLFDLIRTASIAPKTRKPTRPTKASKERRLEGKKVQSNRKRLRAKPFGD